MQGSNAGTGLSKLLPDGQQGEVIQHKYKRKRANTAETAASSNQITVSQEETYRMLDLVLDHSERLLPAHKRGEILHKAAREGDLGLIKYLVEHRKMDVDVADAKGRTVLYFVIASGGLSMMKYMIDVHQVHPDNRCHRLTGNTLLHAAIRCKNRLISNLLIEKGASLDLENYQGETALDGAVRAGMYDLCKLLVQNAKCRSSP